MLNKTVPRLTDPLEHQSATPPEKQYSRRHTRKLLPTGYRKGIVFGTGQRFLPADSGGRPQVWHGEGGSRLQNRVKQAVHATGGVGTWSAALKALYPMAWHIQAYRGRSIEHTLLALTFSVLTYHFDGHTLLHDNHADVI